MHDCNSTKWLHVKLMTKVDLFIVLLFMICFIWWFFVDISNLCFGIMNASIVNIVSDVIRVHTKSSAAALHMVLIN